MPISAARALAVLSSSPYQRILYSQADIVTPTAGTSTPCTARSPKTARSASMTSCCFWTSATASWRTRSGDRYGDNTGNGLHHPDGEGQAPQQVPQVAAPRVTRQGPEDRQVLPEDPHRQRKLLGGKGSAARVHRGDRGEPRESRTSWTFKAYSDYFLEQRELKKEVAKTTLERQADTSRRRACTLARPNSSPSPRPC